MANTRSVFRIPFFIAITIAAGLIVYAYQRFIPYEKKWTRFALGLIWGGAMGNFIDRVFYRKVVDFIDARYHQYQWYVFNVADSCITVGLVILFLSYWFEKNESKRGA
jgi:signal peptidase II